MSVCANSCATGLTKRAQFRLSALGQTIPGLWPEEGETNNFTDQAHGLSSCSLGSQWWVLNLVGC